MRTITISFSLSNNENDFSYEAKSTVPVFYDLGITDLSAIGVQLNAFLRQAGHYRPNDNIFMESLTDDELDAVASFLNDYRKERGNAIE